ncbi:MAG: pilus assembly protein PilZ [Treponemataceae bacterium]|nr:pilus assembly protein PilZ [Treponemataceae bacterium]
MGVTTSQQLTRYYDQFRDTEIAFSKEIVRIIHLDPRQVYIKANGSQWPCIINSASFQMARILVGTKGGAYQMLSQKDAPTCQLRLSFQDRDSQEINLFLTGKVGSIVPYTNSQDLAIVTLEYTQRPPDDFIESIGLLLEANQNTVTRRNEAIVLNEENKRKLGLVREQTIVSIANVPRHCILRSLSFSGAQFVLQGLAQFLNGKEAILLMDFENPPDRVQVKGTIAASNLIEGRKDISLVNMHFDDKLIPLPYKLQINAFLTQQRKPKLSAADQLAQQRAQMQKAAESAQPTPPPIATK